VEVEIDGRLCVNFGSNDYLSLVWHPDLRQSALSAIQTWGTGAGASPLITGRGPWMDELEEAIATFKHAESSLVFGSGFATNMGIIPALASVDDVLFSDQLNHASLIDGCRLSRARIHIYRHSDASDLEAKLAAFRAEGNRALILSDSVFSMDGDIAPIADLVSLAHRFDAQLILDEAHGTGILGEQGRGAAELCGHEASIDVRMGTLSKAVGSVGGFVVGPNLLIDYLVNHARSYIYSTAMSPLSACVSTTAIRLIPSLREERESLMAASIQLRDRLRERGWNVPQGITPIIPIYVKDAEAVVRLSHCLYEQGIFAPAIRPPTVPLDCSMIRLSLTVSHKAEHFDQLLEALDAARSSGQLGLD
jgi:8-amino-7-oxononanoate synthase